MTEALLRLEDVHTYYWLGYTLGMSGGDKVHKIKVTVPSHPEYKVRYRRRYVEKSIETRVQDAVTTGLVLEVEDNLERQLVGMVTEGEDAPEAEDEAAAEPEPEEPEPRPAEPDPAPAPTFEPSPTPRPATAARAPSVRPAVASTAP